MCFFLSFFFSFFLSCFVVVVFVCFLFSSFEDFGFKSITGKCHNCDVVSTGIVSQSFCFARATDL